jgi:hypothetical protein
VTTTGMLRVVVVDMGVFPQIVAAGPRVGLKTPCLRCL